MKRHMLSRTGDTARGPVRLIPTVDVLETEEAVVLVADVPGMSEGTAEVALDADRLSISGRSDVGAPPEGFRALRIEFGPCRFARSFQVHERVDPDGVAASLKNGELVVRLPKKQSVEATKIEISPE